MSERILIANADDGTVSCLRIVPSTPQTPARLELLATSAELPGCGTFAVDSVTNRVYAAFKQDTAGIATLTLDRDSGVLTEHSRVQVPAKHAYLTLANDGQTLLGASYHGGSVTTWPINRDGIIGDTLSHDEYAHVHSVIAHGDSVYAVSLGEDLIAQYTIAPSGHLTAKTPATVAAPASSGPRHIVARGDNAYVMTEFSGKVLHYAVRDNGTLTQTEALNVVDPSARLQHSSFGADPTTDPLIWGADIHLAGGYLITSERNSSKLTVVQLDDASLANVVGYTDTERTPRGFATSPDGRYVVAVGEGSTHAQLLELTARGDLRQVDRTQIGNGANWVRFI